jgi:hypothetical protein
MIGLGLSASDAQTYDLQFVLSQNDGAVYAVTAQIRSTVSTFGLGTANLFFTYDSSAIGTPVLDAALNFSGGLYSVTTVTTPTGNRVSVNIEYTGGTGSGTTVPAAFMDVARIRFTTKKAAGHSTLAWRTGQVNNNVVVFKDDNLTALTAGTLFPFTDAVDPLAGAGLSVKMLPTEYSLSQNYPNPFNPSTVIEFALPKEAHVTLEVYNIIGQKVMTLVDEVRPAGYHSVKFDGTNLASGMYLYRLATGQQTFLKKLLLMK